MSSNSDLQLRLLQAVIITLVLVLVNKPFIEQPQENSQPIPLTTKVF